MSYRKQQSEVTTIDAKKRALALLDDSSSDDESDQGNAELTKKEESLKAAKISRTGETKKELNIDTKPSDKTSPAVDDASNTKIMIEDSGIASDQKMVMTSMGVSIVCEYSAFSGPADKSSSSTNNNITSHGGTDISCPDLHPSSSAFTSTAKLTKALSTRHYFKLIEPNTRDELIYILARSCGDVHDSVMHTMAQLILSDKVG